MPKLKRKPRQTAATLTIWDGNGMTLKGRRLIADWLRRQAETFETDGKLYSRRFTARYLYR